MKRLACLLLTLTACSSSEPPFAYIEVTTPTTQRANALPDFGSAPKAPEVRSEPRKASRGTPRTPAPSYDGSWADLVRSLDWDSATVFRIIQCESGGRPDARNPRSSATGLLQILGGPTDPTANVLLGYSMYQRRGFQPWNASKGCWS